ncbi:ABC transporter permease [Radiobacillus deserti]|uniref:ABC transporter permease n=1 Tax=Radiobacillus deserti TaxID=2594883 RepID=A0A516KDY0_9BACI|nr:ABC transporter permease [Radiobacillus deserti]QDP39516.1 ABC transporter permease [Radiobacillus deserti]
MRSFISKDLLLFWRDKKELVTVLVLPIILVVVLNFAFSGLFGEEKEMSMELAVVNQDEADSMESLKQRLVEDASFDEATAQGLVEQAGHMSPIRMLLDYLTSDGVKDWVTVHQLEEEEAIEQVEAGEVDGVLVIPSGFSEDSLYAAFVGVAPTTSLTFKIEEETNNTETLKTIIDGYLEQVNLQFAVRHVGGSPAMDSQLPKGGLEKLGAEESFTLGHYFTIAMGALFALFLASTVATKTGEEIRQQVFNRILLTNSKPILFLLGKMVSTFCLAWLQIMIVFVLSNLILGVFDGRSITFWLGTIGVVTLLSLSIAGLAAVFTTISLRVGNVDAANGIFMFVILLFGIIGGNFVPVYILPNWLQQIGEWTPNGVSLVMLTDWIQYEQVASLIGPSFVLVGFFVLSTTVGLILYPKRGNA